MDGQPKTETSGWNRGCPRVRTTHDEACWCRRSHSSQAGKQKLNQCRGLSCGPTGAESSFGHVQVEDLGLSDQLITVPKSAPAAKNRFIYYPDRLNKLPHSLLSLGTALQQPALQNFLSALFTEAFKSGRKGKGALDADESVDAFIRRRLGPGVADNLISAMVHGIYAGDSHQLSVRALFHSLWQMERQAGSITVGMMMRRFTDQAKDSAERFERTRDSLTQSSRNKLRNASVWSLKGGLEGLSTRLVERLEAQPNVRLLNNAEVESIDNSSPSEVQVSRKSTKKMCCITDRFTLQIKYTRANQSKVCSGLYPAQSHFNNSCSPCIADPFSIEPSMCPTLACSGQAPSITTSPRLQPFCRRRSCQPRLPQPKRRNAKRQVANKTPIACRRLRLPDSPEHKPREQPTPSPRMHFRLGRHAPS